MHKSFKSTFLSREKTTEDCLHQLEVLSKETFMLSFSGVKQENDQPRIKGSEETINEVIDEEFNEMSVTIKTVAMLNMKIDSFL